MSTDLLQRAIKNSLSVRGNDVRCPIFD